MTRNRAIVTFAAPSSTISSPQWPHIQSALKSLLPLRNIHWKLSFKPSITTIHELPASLVPLDSIREELVSQVPITLLERPLVNLYIAIVRSA